MLVSGRVFSPKFGSPILLSLRYLELEPPFFTHRSQVSWAEPLVRHDFSWSKLVGLAEFFWFQKRLIGWRLASNHCLILRLHTLSMIPSISLFSHLLGLLLQSLISKIGILQPNNPKICRQIGRPLVKKTKPIKNTSPIHLHWLWWSARSLPSFWGFVVPMVPMPEPLEAWRVARHGTRQSLDLVLGCHCLSLDTTRFFQAVLKG